MLYSNVTSSIIYRNFEVYFSPKQKITISILGKFKDNQIAELNEDIRKMVAKINRLRAEIDVIVAEIKGDN